MSSINLYLGLMVLVHLFSAGMNLSQGARTAAAVNTLLAGLPLGFLISGVR